MNSVVLALAINRLGMLRANEKTMLAEIVDTESFYRSLDAGSLSQIVGRQVSVDVSMEDTLTVAERDLEFCRRRAVRVIPLWDQRYPPALREIFDPPFLLFVRGQLPPADLPAVAIVGTREPGAAACSAARKLGAQIAARGLCVVSGLARGIDVAAHRGALDTGATAAILGCGIDSVSPASNRPVASRILDSGGMLASEYSPGIPTAKYHFPARNRIISGLSRAVIVVQAPAKSGALITAEYALDQGRDLYVHQSGIEGSTSVGTRELAEDGARIITDAQELFDDWGYAPTVPEPVRGSQPQAIGASEHAARSMIKSMRDLLQTESGSG